MVAQQRIECSNSNHYHPSAPMKILEYGDLDISGVEPQYRKLIGMIEHGDFYSAEIKKLTPSDYYRGSLITAM